LLTDALATPLLVNAHPEASRVMHTTTRTALEGECPNKAGVEFWARNLDPTEAC